MATILLIDDQASLLELLAAVLRDKGHRVLASTGGNEALQLAFGCLDTIDLVISDIQMPQMSGFELCRELCQRRPELKVLFISGCTEYDALVRPLLKKPFGMPAFLATVGKLLLAG